jgi:hypothetical protein
MLIATGNKNLAYYIGQNIFRIISEFCPIRLVLVIGIDDKPSCQAMVPDTTFPENERHDNASRQQRQHDVQSRIQWSFEYVYTHPSFCLQSRFYGPNDYLVNSYGRMDFWPHEPRPGRKDHPEGQKLRRQGD